MHAAVKVIVGLIFVVIGLGLLSNGVLFTVESVGTFWLKNFITTLTGIIPPFLILIESKFKKAIPLEEKRGTNFLNALLFHGFPVYDSIILNQGIGKISRIYQSIL